VAQLQCECTDKTARNNDINVYQGRVVFAELL